MNIKNLERAKEIAEQLPALEEARRILSTGNGRVFAGQNTVDVELPKCINMNVIAAINAEINKLKEETANL